jgi:ribulose-phosphate 3-epimerase
MDGHFVPNITIGPLVVKAVRSVTTLPLDVHLMISEPERYLDAFAEAGASMLTVHAEASAHLHRLVQRIRGLGVRAGVSLNPATPEAVLSYVLPLLDLVLLMTVNPGFGGQTMIYEVLPKIAKVRTMLDDVGSSAWLSVDGGVDVETTPLVVGAGARMLVSGSAVFGAPQGINAAIRALRSAAQSAW